MKGRGEIIAILCMSVFLICILYVMTYGGIVKAEELEKQPEKVGEKTEVDIEEELRWAEEVKKILKDIGVGVCDEQEDKQEEAFDQTDEKKIQSIGVYASAREGDTVYTKKIERGIGAIDVVDYNDPNWPVLQHWNEGRLGTQSGESLYCTNPTLKFQEGNKTAVDASKRYNKQTIQMIAAMFYYYDENKCNGVSSNYDYLLKQCAVWWIMNEVHHWYGDMIRIETGNSVACGNGHWISTHKSEYYHKGIAWAKENYKYFPDAYGVIYEGNGQPLSKWGGTYQPTGTGRLKKVSANTSVTEKNSCYSLEGAEYGIYSSPTLSGESRAGTFRTDSAGNSSTVVLNEGTYYVKELKAPKGYALVDEVKTVTVKSGQEATVTFSDPPQMNPVELLLKKTGMEQEYVDPSGTAAYQGAQFLVKFYAELLDLGKNPEKEGKEPVRSWVFQTDAKAVCRYQEKYKVKGDALYKMTDGTEALPLGTVTIQEIKPPKGYFLNEEVFVFQIKSEGTGEKINVYQNPTIPDRVFQIHLVKKATETGHPLSGAQFKHIRPDGSEKILTTDEKGTLKVMPLSQGTHKLKEVKAPDGYRTNNNELIFQVDESGKTEFLSEVNTEEGEVIIEYTEDGIAVVTIEDKPACYKIELKKENEKGVALAGAEFTLYEDQACQKEIDRVLTDGNGIAMFENLEVKKKYYMKETKAPIGYRIPKTSDDADIVYEICLESNPEEGKCLLVVNGKEYRSKDTADSKISIEGSIKEWNVKMKIINQTGKKLPDTGSAGKPVLLTGILAVGIMAMIYRKKEQKR